MLLLLVSCQSSRQRCGTSSILQVKGWLTRAGSPLAAAQLASTQPQFCMILATFVLQMWNCTWCPQSCTLSSPCPCAWGTLTTLFPTGSFLRTPSRCSNGHIHLVCALQPATAGGGGPGEWHNSHFTHMRRLAPQVGHGSPSTQTRMWGPRTPFFSLEPFPSSHGSPMHS